MISGFRREVAENLSVLGCYAASSDNFLPTLRDNLSVPPPTLFLIQVRHKSINTPLSHERLVGGLQDGGRGTHVTHFVELYPQPLYTASQVRMICRSWDEGVLTDVCLTGVLTDLCLTLYILRWGYRLSLGFLKPEDGTNRL